MQTKKWKIVVDSSKIERATNVTFRSKGERIFIRAYVDLRNQVVYVDSPIADPSVRSRLIGYARKGAI